MKRVIPLILCFCLVAALFGGCGIDPGVTTPTGDALVMEGQDPSSIGPQQEIVIQEFSMAYYPDRSLNPLTCNDFTNRALFSLMYQGLFATDANYQVTPILCKQWQVSPDNKTWTFYIEEAYFSDGTRLTIDDVYATYQAAQECKYYEGRFTHVYEILLSEDGGIIFDLYNPFENLPLLLDIPILKASEIEAERPLGTGPYRLADSISGVYLQQVDSWWCNAELAVNALSIPLVAADSPSQIRDEFEFSDVGLVCTDPGTASYADYRCDYELWDCDNGVMLYLGCNVLLSDFFSDEGVRAALTYAIDRQYIVDSIYRGLALPSTLCTSPRAPYYSESLARQYEHDSMQFIEALSNYGLVMNHATLLVNSDDTMRLRTARAIAEMLTELGLPTVVDEQDGSSYRGKLSRGEYDLYLGQTKLSPNMDLSEFFRNWGAMSGNGIANNEIYALCKGALANQGNYYDMLKAIADDGRICPILFSGNFVYADRGLLTDLSPSRDNVFYYDLGKTMEDCQIPTIYD